MPLFAPETLIGKVVRIELMSSSYGPQLEIEYETPDPEAKNRREWLKFSNSDGDFAKPNARSVTAWWLMQAALVDQWIDGLDFRTNATTQKSIDTMCKKMMDQWYLLESRLPDVRLPEEFKAKLKEKLTPARKFKTEQEALNAWAAENGEEVVEKAAGIPESVVASALTIYQSVEKNDDAIKMLAASQFPNVDVEELLVELHKRVG